MKHVTLYHGFYTGCTNEWTFTSWDKGLIVAWTRDAFLTSSLKHKLKKVGFWFLSTHGQPNKCYHWPLYALVSHQHIHCSHHRYHNSNHHHGYHQHRVIGGAGLPLTLAALLASVGKSKKHTFSFVHLSKTAPSQSLSSPPGGTSAWRRWWQLPWQAFQEAGSVSYYDY